MLVRGNYCRYGIKLYKDGFFCSNRLLLPLNTAAFQSRVFSNTIDKDPLLKIHQTVSKDERDFEKKIQQHDTKPIHSFKFKDNTAPFPTKKHSRLKRMTPAMSDWSQTPNEPANTSEEPIHHQETISTEKTNYTSPIGFDTKMSTFRSVLQPSTFTTDILRLIVFGSAFYGLYKSGEYILSGTRKLMHHVFITKTNPILLEDKQKQMDIHDRVDITKKKPVGKIGTIPYTIDSNGRRIVVAPNPKDVKKLIDSQSNNIIIPSDTILPTVEESSVINSDLDINSLKTEPIILHESKQPEISDVPLLKEQSVNRMTQEIISKTDTKNNVNSLTTTDTNELSSLPHSTSVVVIDNNYPIIKINVLSGEILKLPSSSVEYSINEQTNKSNNILNPTGHVPQSKSEFIQQLPSPLIIYDKQIYSPILRPPLTTVSVISSQEHLSMTLMNLMDSDTDTESTIVPDQEESECIDTHDIKEMESHDSIQTESVNDTLPLGITELITVLGNDKVITDIETCEERTKEAWSYHTGERPFAIIYPESTEDVSTLLRISNKHHLSVIPYGSGTSLEGHTIGAVKGIICDMSHMDSVLNIRPNDADMTVQAGIQWMDLNDAIKDTGFFFPMDPGPGAAIGGMIGTCCSGTNAVRYGVMRDWVLQIKVVLANGNRARKDTAGYDLLRLFIGSEGTLGIITETTLKLSPIPQHEIAAICGFPTTEKACGAVSEIIRQGTPVFAAEYLDPLSIGIVNSQSNYGFSEVPTIMFKFAGTPGQLTDAQEAARRVCEEFGGGNFENYNSADNQVQFERLWSARKNLLFNVIGWGNGRQSWITDVCVPIGRLPNVLQETIDDLAQSPLDAPVFGHVGDGNFHAAILFNPENKEEHEEAEALNARIIYRALNAEGTCTGEHGIGIGKKEFLKKQISPRTLELMKSIKKLLDPNNILNPGKVFDLNDKDDKMISNT